jgi:uncharacterized repeat protein (TIGR04138 family)
MYARNMATELLRHGAITSTLPNARNSEGSWSRSSRLAGRLLAVVAAPTGILRTRDLDQPFEEIGLSSRPEWGYRITRLRTALVIRPRRPSELVEGERFNWISGKFAAIVIREGRQRGFAGQNLRYPQERSPLPVTAYAAIHKGLDYTMKMKQVVGHVDGQELAVGMAGYLNQEYGPFARSLLNGWGIHSTLDFGRLVFNLVESGLMRKQETDSLDDFSEVYNFDEVFNQPYDWLSSIRGELGLPAPKPDPSR